jgi:hypothetical protein
MSTHTDIFLPQIILGSEVEINSKATYQQAICLGNLDIIPFQILIGFFWGLKMV